MHGNLVTSIHCLQLSCITYQMTGKWVCDHFNFLPVRANHCTEELLIEFQELVRKHTGENQAEAVWDTMELYALQGWVCSYLNLWTEYVSNVILGHHNQLWQCIECLEQWYNVGGCWDLKHCSWVWVQCIFDAQEGCIWYMPHAVHLPALEVNLSPVP